jgi:hypothetical protein
MRRQADRHEIEQVGQQGEEHCHAEPDDPARNGRQEATAEQRLHGLRAEAEAEEEAQDRQQDQEEAIPAQQQDRAEEQREHAADCEREEGIGGHQSSYVAPVAAASVAAWAVFCGLDFGVGLGDRFGGLGQCFCLIRLAATSVRSRPGRGILDQASGDQHARRFGHRGLLDLVGRFERRQRGQDRRALHRLGERDGVFGPTTARSSAPTMSRASGVRKPDDRYPSAAYCVLQFARPQMLDEQHQRRMIGWNLILDVLQIADAQTEGIVDRDGLSSQRRAERFTSGHHRAINRQTAGDGAEHFAVVQGQSRSRIEPTTLPSASLRTNSE